MRTHAYRLSQTEAILRNQVHAGRSWCTPGLKSQGCSSLQQDGDKAETRLFTMN